MLVAALALFIALALVVTLVRAHLRFWVRRLTVPLVYATTETLETADGSRIELRRLPAVADVEIPLLPPVLIVHGLGANHRNNDLHPDASLARALAAVGRDVWLLTLRSGVGGWTPAEASRVRFEGMVTEDLPLAIGSVLDRTGAAALDYVGFSMGGMLLYAALGRTVAEPRLRRVVILGSPARVAAPRLFLPLLRRVPRWLVPHGRYKLGAHALAFASEWVRTPIHRMIVNPENVTVGLTRTALVNMVEDVPAPLHADLLSFATRDGAIRVDGEPVLPRLATVAIPALFFGGIADRLAPPDAVQAAFDAWGSARPGLRKRFVVLGRSYGARADYGHADLAMGVHAAIELFAPIARFLGEETP
jgi:pimeloyl-ACP methyl ester carboxylesterase